MLIPDWNHTQVSRSSACGKVRAISRIIALEPAMATSYSGTPSAMAARMASPPRSPIRAPCLMSSISSGDLTIRWRIVAAATSVRVRPGRASETWPAGRC